MLEAAAALLPATTIVYADTIRVEATRRGDRAQVVLAWPAPVGFSTEERDGRLIVRFDRPLEGDFWAIRKLRRFTGLPAIGEDGRSLTFPLRRTVAAVASAAGDKVVVDFGPARPQPGATEPSTTAPTAAPQPADATAPLPPEQSNAAVPSAGAAANGAAATPTAAERPAAAAKEHAALRFQWDRPVAAAVFRRGETLWCVFDSPSQQDTTALAGGAGLPVRRIEQEPHDRATVLRIAAEAGIEPRLERDGLAWILGFSPVAPGAGEPITPTPDFSSAAGPRLVLPVAEPGLPLAVTDPEIGDTLVVVPVVPLASRLAGTYTYPQFRLLASLQGIVVQPLIDTLRVRSLRDGVDITSSDGLAISPVATAGQSAVPRLGPDRLLDPRGWTDDGSAGFAARRRTLERSVIDSTGAERDRNRLRLAQFLLGHRFAVEALGILVLATEERPALAAEPRLLLLRGAARVMAGRTAEARDDLARAGASGVDEVGMWAAAARAAAGESPADLSRLPQWTAIALGYPAALRGPLTAMLAEAAVAAGKSKEAGELLDIARPDAKSAEERARIAYLEGMRKQADGDIEGALASFDQAAAIDPRRGRARAELARTLLLRREERISVDQAIAALDALRFAWRGDEIELRLLRELGRLYLQAGDYPAALRTLKLAASGFPGLPGSDETTKQMVQAFEQLYLEGGADRLPPVKALALYEEFKELTPAGDRGTEMVAKLADRLVQVDLLDRAASLLEGLLPRVSPSEKARLGARLAEIRVVDGKPEAALEDLRRTANPGVPPELQRRRSLAQGRALAALGRSDEALAALGRDDSLDAELLRAKVFRGRGEWDRVATALRRVVEAARAAPTTPLGEQQARDVLDLAVALTLAGSDSQVARLELDYGSAMATTPLKDAFRLIAGTAPLSEADAAALADLVEKAMAFLRSLTPPAPPAGR